MINSEGAYGSYNERTRRVELLMAWLRVALKSQADDVSRTMDAKVYWRATDDLAAVEHKLKSALKGIARISGHELEEALRSGGDCHE